MAHLRVFMKGNMMEYVFGFTPSAIQSSGGLRTGLAVDWWWSSSVETRQYNPIRQYTPITRALEHCSGPRLFHSLSSELQTTKSNPMTQISSNFTICIHLCACHGVHSLPKSSGRSGWDDLQLGLVSLHDQLRWFQVIPQDGSGLINGTICTGKQLESLDFQLFYGSVHPGQLTCTSWELIRLNHREPWLEALFWGGMSCDPGDGISVGLKLFRGFNGISWFQCSPKWAQPI